MKFVVIGGDAAGMSAASRAKRNLPDLEATVLEKTTDVSFSACGMPYNIADPARDIEDLVVRQADVFREKQGINLLTGHRVEKIDPAGKSVTGVGPDGAAFSFAYDKLLIATGARPVVPEIPGIDLPGVMVLRNLKHGRRIKSFLKEHAVKKAVILGMGSIALEMAESFRTLGMDVDMVKPRPGLIPWMDPSMSRVIQDELEAQKVGIYDGHPVKSIEKSGAGLRVICADRTFETDMVLAAAGVIPNSELAEDAGLALSVRKSIAVDPSMRTSNPDIFAAGDCADSDHLVSGKKVWTPLALRANRGGWAVADALAGKDVRLEGVVGTAVFKLFGLEVARTGLSVGEARSAGFDPEATVIQSRSRAHAHPGSTTIWVQIVGDKKSGRLLGVQMVGREGAAHRINAPAVALHAGMSVEAYSQMDLAYAPPFGPALDPTLAASLQLVKALS